MGQLLLKKFDITHENLPAPEKGEAQPAAFSALVPILVPIGLIAFKSIADYPTHPFGDGDLASALRFVGNPMIALLLGVISVFVLGKGSASDQRSLYINFIQSHNIPSSEVGERLPS